MSCAPPSTDDERPPLSAADIIRLFRENGPSLPIPAENDVVVEALRRHMNNVRKELKRASDPVVKELARVEHDLWETARRNVASLAAVLPKLIEREPVGFITDEPLDDALPMLMEAIERALPYLGPPAPSNRHEESWHSGARFFEFYANKVWRGAGAKKANVYRVVRDALLLVDGIDRDIGTIAKALSKDRPG